MTYVVGLTGGICSGKSTVSEYFQALGVPIIDADIIAREIVAPGTPCFSHIVSHFGSDILLNQQLDRKKLRHIIFQEAHERLWLEKLLHPAIFQEIKHQISTITQPYCIVVIPLLAESYNRYKNIVHSVLVVDISEDEQIQRLMQRDQSTIDEAQKIISTQASRDARLKVANQVLSNQADLSSLKRAVAKLHQQYLINAQN